MPYIVIGGVIDMKYAGDLITATEESSGYRLEMEYDTLTYMVMFHVVCIETKGHVDLTGMDVDKREWVAEAIAGFISEIAN